MNTPKEITLSVLVDKENKIMFVTKEAVKAICILSHPVSNSYFMMKSKFPDFTEIIVPTLGTIIED